MSLNEEYAKLMGNKVEVLVEHHKYDKGTNHVTFDPAKVQFPEGVTSESLQTHVTFINDTTTQVREAVAQIARNEFKNNDKLTTLDGTLDVGGVIFNSQHHLKQSVGEENWLYGLSTTQVTYHHSQDNADYMASRDKVNIEMATQLFSK